MAIGCRQIVPFFAAAALGLAAFLGNASAAGPGKVDDPSASIPLAPHRAVYDRKLVDSVDGHADKGAGGVTVTLMKPQPKSMDIGTAVFPSEHMRRIIAAARAGERLLEVTVYDGSENGDKVYQSLTVIGKKIGPNEQPPKDAAAGQAAFANLDRWPVTISYFDRAKQGGEQTPVYAITFEAYENGVARALVLDYGDFTVTGDLTSLEMKTVKPCEK